ncbi:hypothetical protein [Pararhizobium sp. O133]|uniref:hypothetical protein n=1 Tax=Pararhizobium sp. O133 TaxID=3449278 RepID=UPI003F689003
MLHGPQPHWAGEYRRRQCRKMLAPAISVLAEHAHLSGWTIEEVLIAIGDIADDQLFDTTAPSPATFIENDDARAEKAVEKLYPLRASPMSYRR